MFDLPLVALLLSSGTALLLTLILTPLFRRAAVRIGLVDAPDGRRKLQSTAIPKAGGPAVLVATLAVLAAVSILQPGFMVHIAGDGRFWSLMAVAAAFIGLVGLVDDFRGLRGRYKLLGQIIAVSMLVFPGGLYVGSVTLFGTDVDLGVFGLVFTFFWMLGCINALNLIDGMDGLLGVVAIIVCSTLTLVGALAGNWLVAVVAATLVGSLIGFLVFNLPPARVYLGDCGSMVIGLVVGALSIQSSIKGPTAAALLVPGALLVIPILDTGAALVRRILTGRSVFTTDRGHLHHCLLRRGMSQGGVLVLVGALSLAAAGGGILSLVFKTDIFAIIGATTVVIGLLLTRRFGTAEARLILERARAVWGVVINSRAIDRNHNGEVHLQGSAAWNEIWLRLTDTAEELRLRTLRLDVNLPAVHEAYHARWQRFGGGRENNQLWRAELPLFMGAQVIGRLTVVGCPDGGPVASTLSRLGTMISQAEEDVASVFTVSRNEALDQRTEGVLACVA